MNIPLSPCVPENLVSRDGFSRPVPRQPTHLHTQAESGAYLRDSSRVPRRRPFMKPPYAIGSVPSLSGHAIAYRWRSLPRVRRHRASKHQGSSERVLPWQITMDQIIFASLSHTHYWYEVGMLKVPAVIIGRDDCYTRGIHHCNAQLRQEVRERNLFGNFEGLQPLQRSVKKAFQDLSSGLTAPLFSLCSGEGVTDRLLRRRHLGPVEGRGSLGVGSCNVGSARCGFCRAILGFLFSTPATATSAVSARGYELVEKLSLVSSYLGPAEGRPRGRHSLGSLKSLLTVPAPPAVVVTTVLTATPIFPTRCHRLGKNLEFGKFSREGSRVHDLESTELAHLTMKSEG